MFDDNCFRKEFKNDLIIQQDLNSNIILINVLSSINISLSTARIIFFMKQIIFNEIAFIFRVRLASTVFIDRDTDREMFSSMTFLRERSKTLCGTGRHKYSYNSASGKKKHSMESLNCYSVLIPVSSNVSAFKIIYFYRKTFLLI